jgi:hypothetical protein
MGPLAIAGIASAASAIGSGFTNWGNKRAARRARAHDLNMWDKTNAYNDPKSQMERLRNAGLNPNMVYGGSSGQTAGTANALPGAKAPDYNMDIGKPMQDYITFKNTEAQTDNHRAQFKVINEEANLKNAQYMHELDKIDLTKMSTKERAAAISKINQEKQLALSRTQGQNYNNEISKYQASWAKYGLQKGDNMLHTALKVPIDGFKQAMKKYQKFKNSPDGFQYLYNDQ